MYNIYFKNYFKYNVKIKLQIKLLKKKYKYSLYYIKNNVKHYNQIITTAVIKYFTKFK